VIDGSNVPRRPGRLNTLQKAAVAELLRISPVSDELGVRFAVAGHELHLVGGSVRDALLGRLEDDLDFTTDARPDQVLALVAGWADGTWGTGIDFGTVGVMKSGFRLEITTFRSDLYDGDTRNPVVTFGDSLTGDLQRRDFAVVYTHAATFSSAALAALRALEVEHARRLTATVPSAML
jgi:poly(A) polymerase